MFSNYIFYSIICLSLFPVKAFAFEPWLETSGRAVYAQMEMEQKLQELTRHYIPKELQIKIGDVSIVINVLLQKRIQYKATFP